MYYIFFIHSSVDGHLYCLHVLAIVNSTVANIWKHASKAGIFICFLLTVSLVPRTVPDSWLVLSKDFLNEAISVVFNVSLKTTTIVQQFWGCAVCGVAQNWTWLKRFSSSSSSCIIYHYASAAAAKLHQSCPTLWPHRQQPTRLLHLWDFPGKSTGVGCHCQILKSRGLSWL